MLLYKNLLIQKNVEMPSIDIGLYVRFVVEGVISHEPLSFQEEGEREGEGEGEETQIYINELIFWIDHEWKIFMKTFPMGVHTGIAMVDLNLSISREALYNSVGFACLIAMKMNTNRILLSGSVQIFIYIY